MVFALTEILGTEEFLRADDLGAAAGRAFGELERFVRLALGLAEQALWSSPSRTTKNS